MSDNQEWCIACNYSFTVGTCPCKCGRQLTYGALTAELEAAKKEIAFLRDDGVMATSDSLMVANNQQAEVISALTTALTEIIDVSYSTDAMLPSSWRDIAEQALAGIAEQANITEEFLSQTDIAKQIEEGGTNEGEQ